MLLQVGRLPFNLLCKSMTSLFRTNQFLRPLVMYIRGFLFTRISSILFLEELFMFSNPVLALCISDLAFVISVSSFNTSLVRFALIDLQSLCLARIPHENADLHGLKVHDFLV